MDKIKESGNYLAVKVPENTWDYYYGETKRKLFYDQHSMVLGFIDLRDFVMWNEKAEVIGLLSEIRDTNRPLFNELFAFAVSLNVSEFEWNQWLIIKKLKNNL